VEVSEEGQAGMLILLGLTALAGAAAIGGGAVGIGALLHSLPPSVLHSLPPELLHLIGF